MLKFLHYMTDSNEVYVTLVVFILTIVVSVVATVIATHLFLGKKATVRSWAWLAILLVGFALLNIVTLSELKTNPGEIGKTLTETLTLILKFNVGASAVTAPVIGTIYFLRRVKRSFNKARKAARKRKQEEYYQ